VHHGRVVHRRDGLFDPVVRCERRTNLRECPAFDDGEMVLDDVARRHLREQHARRDTGIDRVFARFQFSGDVHLPGEKPPIQRFACVNTGSVEHAHDAGQCGAERDID
jgi:hypothetical protein